MILTEKNGSTQRQNLLSITPLPPSFPLGHGVELKSAYYGDRLANDPVAHSAAFWHVSYISIQVPMFQTLDAFVFQVIRQRKRNHAPPKHC